MYERAFRSATVTPQNNRTMALTPDLLGSIGRELVRGGEVLFLIEVIGGQVVLSPAGTWDVRGSFQKSSWSYRLDLFGPSRHRTVRVGGDSVVHAMFSYDTTRPYLGVGPVQWARQSGKLAANIEQRAAQEAGTPVGQLLPIPRDPGAGGSDDPLAKMKKQFENLKGKLAMVETSQGGWGDKSSTPKNDWMPQRIGADPPAPLVSLREQAIITLCQACGIPAGLVTSSDATSTRESWRQFLHGSISPLAKGVEQELREKLNVPDLKIGFENLFASDISGRARAFASMVKGSMDVEKAAALSGLLIEED